MLKHWACAKILRSKPTSASKDTGVDDEQVCRAIVRKFQALGSAGVSYAEIARKAWEVGRTELATKVGNFACMRKDQGLTVWNSCWIMNRNLPTKYHYCSA